MLIFLKYVVFKFALLTFVQASTSLLMKLGAASIEDSTSFTSFPLALPINESIKLSPSSYNSLRTFFKACFVLTLSGTISSSFFFFLGLSFFTSAGLTSSFFFSVVVGASFGLF